MAREIQYDSSAQPVVYNLYAAIFNAQAQVWNGSAFVELSTAPAAAMCLIQVAQLGASPLYAADMPAGIAASDAYYLYICTQTNVWKRIPYGSW